METKRPITDTISHYFTSPDLFTVGFIYGASTHMIESKKSKILERPLKSIFYASCDGFLCGLGASVIGMLVPENLHIVVPIAVVAGIGYSAMYKSNKKDNIDIDIDNIDNVDNDILTCTSTNNDINIRINIGSR